MLALFSSVTNPQSSNILEQARFFVLKCTLQQHIEASQAHCIWSSNSSINQKLNKAFSDTKSGPVIIFILLPGNGFCGVARMSVGFRDDSLSLQ